MQIDPAGEEGGEFLRRTVRIEKGVEPLKRTLVRLMERLHNLEQGGKRLPGPRDAPEYAGKQQLNLFAFHLR